ncbi:MAG: DegV family protein [Chloroflexota bacterium]|nr:MAG: DegV family protein [Chloroflexota bacterium]
MNRKDMTSIAIIADSIACIPKKQAEDYGIKIIPVNILFNGQVYRDVIDLSSAQAYEFLEKAPEFWKSSAASPDDYLKAYREISRHAQGILVVTISSKLSMFYTSALDAKEIFKDESPQTVVEVIDSETAAAAEGLIALAAARAVAEGKPFDEVVAIARKVKERVKFLGLLETIRYVYRTGRIPKVASEIGSMLSIKPILTGSKGRIHFAAAARTKQSGIKKMLQIMRNHVGDSEPVRVTVMHADALEEAEKLKEKVAAEFNCVEIFITDLSPVMGYATGRGTIALAYYKEGSFDK